MHSRCCSVSSVGISASCCITVLLFLPELLRSVTTYLLTYYFNFVVCVYAKDLLHFIWYDVLPVVSLIKQTHCQELLLSRLTSFVHYLWRSIQVFFVVVFSHLIFLNIMHI